MEMTASLVAVLRHGRLTAQLSQFLKQRLQPIHFILSRDAMMFHLRTAGYVARTYPIEPFLPHLYIQCATLFQ